MALRERNIGKRPHKSSSFAVLCEIAAIASALRGGVIEAANEARRANNGSEGRRQRTHRGAYKPHAQSLSNDLSVRNGMAMPPRKAANFAQLRARRYRGAQHSRASPCLKAKQIENVNKIYIIIKAGRGRR